MARVTLTYNQARFCPIGHEIRKQRKTRQSSKISCDQKSPTDYPYIGVPQPSYSVDQNETIKVKRSLEEYSKESDHGLVEGRDYDVILVYVVNPDIYDVPSDDEVETMDCDSEDSRQFPSTTSDTSDPEDQEKIEKIKRYLMEDNGSMDCNVMNTHMTSEDLDLIDLVLDKTYNTPT